MTDARLPDRWLLDPRFDRLSDSAFRVFANSLMYGAQQESDGLLEARAVRFLHPVEVSPEVIEELVVAKLWKRLPKDEFLVIDWSKSQSTAAQLAQARENNRVKQQNYRERKKKVSDPKSLPGTSPVTSPATSEARTGQAGKAGQEHEVPAREDEAAEPEYAQAWKRNPPQRGRAA